MNPQNDQSSAVLLTMNPPQNGCDRGEGRGSSTLPSGQDNLPGTLGMLLEERAITQGWAIPDGVRQAVVARAARTINDPNASDRSAMAAGRLLVAADSVDVRREAIHARERRSRLHEASLLIREAITIPEIRSALAQLTQQAIQPAPESPSIASDGKSSSEPTS